MEELAAKLKALRALQAEAQAFNDEVLRAFVDRLAASASPQFAGFATWTSEVGAFLLANGYRQHMEKETAKLLKEFAEDEVFDIELG